MVNPFPLTSYRRDEDKFMRASLRWNLVRYYVMVLAVPAVLTAALFTWLAVNDAQQPIEEVPAIAVESSRPLDGEDKAPADWTEDGKADGWMYGEWLPGQEGTVYVSNGEQVSAPLGAFGYAVLGFMFVCVFSLAAVVFAYLIHDRLGDRAWQAAREDWRTTVAKHADSWREGRPLWEH